MISASRLLIRITIVIGVLVLGSSSVWAESPAAAAEQGPTATIKAAVGELFRVLDDESLKAPERADDRRRAIEQVLKTRVSYEEMAQRALGAPWTLLSAEERREFVDLFVQLLRDAFANRIDDRTDEHVIYRGEIVHDTFAEVHTQLVGRKIDTTLDFRVVDHGGAWLVYDVVIDGASVVFNYRAQFTQVIKEASYVGLVKQMRQKTATLKRFETSPQQQPPGN
jgi:phospholipid transport system substrate-binding protein